MKLCVALDLPTKEENLALAKELEGFDLWLKVGLRSYIRDGKEFVKELKDMGFNIFLDLKLYDIPNTMADAAQEITRLGVDMFNIHASAGKEAMRQVMQRIENEPKRPLVLAVTALTSFDERGFREIYNQDLKEAAVKFAKMSYENGLDGVVCSAFESPDIKNETSKDFLTLTPGIRPFNEAADDQKRVATVDMAKQNMVDFIVVGRPVYKSKNPKEAVEKILTKI